MRRYVYIGGIVGIVAVLALFFVFVFNRASTPAPASTGTTGTLPIPNIPAGSGSNGGTGNTNNTSGASPLTALVPSQTPQGLGLISNELALNYFVTASNTVLMAEPDGKIEQISAGQSSYLSSSQIKNVLSADFSYDGKKVLVSFGDPQSPQWSLFDVAKKAWSVAPVSPIVAAWSPTNYQIAYFAPAGSGWTFATIDLAAAKPRPRVLLSLPGGDFRIIWNAANDILLADRANALFSGSILDFNLKTNTLGAVVRNRVGLQTQWNNAGTMGVILAGTALGRGGTLGIIDRGGNLLHQLTFLTLPSKCVFNDGGGAAGQNTTATKAPAGKNTSSSASVAANPPVPTLICGVPRASAGLSSKALPEAYDERAILTADDFFSVNLNNGDISSVFNDPSQILDASDVKIFNGTLFFIDRYDNRLYALPLPQ